MRAVSDFTRAHAKLLRSILPDSGLDAEATASLARVELCLRYVGLHLEGRDVAAVPHLLLGYDGLAASFATGEGALRHLANLRHVASRLGAVAAWNEALRAHGAAHQALRCHEVSDGRVVVRRTANPKLLAHLDATLEGPVAWEEQRVSPAEPGEFRVRANRNQSVLAYSVPPVEVPPPDRYAFAGRPRHAPIHLSMADLIDAAHRVDAREASPDWPDGIRPLSLARRLAEVRLEGTAQGFWDAASGYLTLDGVTHLVGMLSSGKSTLVWGLLFGLTLDRPRPHRIALMATDTVQAAAYATRLGLHGVSATVLSSARRRDRHLEGIHWQQGNTPGGATLQNLGEAVEGFGTACPLDGFQAEARVVQGIVRGGNRDFPALDEKPCHALQPVHAPPEEGERKHDGPVDDDADERRSCPLWSRCPLQSQQRDAVKASVLILTPEAFAHMAPDRWVSGRRITIPELLQFEADVVLVDEVDAVQKRLDGVFAPLSPIMGDERDVFAPFVGRQTSEALRKRSGAQFRNPVNTRWQSNFFNFFRLVGVMYGLLQSEEEALAPFFGDGPFTAGSLLHDLRRLRHRRDGTEGGSADAEFLQVASVAAGIARAAMSEEDGDSAGADRAAAALAPEFRAAAEALGRCALAVFRADDYRPPVEALLRELDGPLAPFEAAGARQSRRETLSREANALVLLLAVTADLVLWHYHWLVRLQAAVARDLGMEDGALFGAAANLGKHYRTVIPANPAGSLFGLQYDPPRGPDRNLRGGRLTLVNHLGVGRHLLCHLHDLLAHEGQAGPHVLLLSGTSWAGGGIVRSFPARRPGGDAVIAEVASPVYDVQVPVKGVLRQPDGEVEAVGRSIFRLMPFMNAGASGKPASALRASGLPQPVRRQSLSDMTRRLAEKRDLTNTFEQVWDEMEARWPDGSMADRRRAMLVVNSYADAQAVSVALAAALPPSREAPWHVRCLVPDRDDPEVGFPDGLRDADRLPRAVVERFGETPERSVLVAPLSVVARGHNILNGHGKAAISTIYFLHRPHPRPDDLSSAVGRLNRYAIDRFDRRVDPSRYDGLADCARRMRFGATAIVREAMDNRGGFSTLPPHLKASFAWDLLTPLWQAIGRGIRGGVPVFVGFVDRQFAPGSMDGAAPDTPDSSALVLARDELRRAVNPGSNPDGHGVAARLYGPFLDALSRTEGLS